jgi:hypothetical protein
VKKLVAVLGAVLVPAAFLIGPAGAGDVPQAATRVGLSGTPVAGTVLQVVPADWATAPDSRRYEWLRDGEGDVLSTQPSYTTSAADVGHSLVVVERVRFGTREDETSSVPVTVSVPTDQPVLVAPGAIVSGSRAVGGRLRVDLAGGTPGASTAVQWQRDGADVPGAAAPAYVLTRNDAGRTMTVRTSSSMAGRSTVAGGSTAVNVAALSTRRPTVKGTAKVRKRLSVKSKGTFIAPGHTYRYQWFRGGKKISRATKTAYNLTSKDRRKQISVRVTVTRPGFPSVTARSGTKRVK